MKVTKKLLKEVAEQHNKGYPAEYWEASTAINVGTKEPKQEGGEKELSYIFKNNGSSEYAKNVQYSDSRYANQNTKDVIINLFHSEIQKAEQRVRDDRRRQAIGGRNTAYQLGYQDGKKWMHEEYDPIFQWLLGCSDFPERKEGQGAYWWRDALREKLAEIHEQVERSLPDKNVQ